MPTWSMLGVSCLAPVSACVFSRWGVLCDHVEGGVSRFIPSCTHKVVNVGEENLEFLSICVPAWEPSNSVFLEEA